MSKVRHVLGVVATLALTIGAVAIPAAASAAVSDGAVFNNPKVASEQYRIRDHVKSLIDAAPDGSTIQVAMYHFGETTISNALIDAHSRGVQVRVVVDYSSAAFQPVIDLKAALGTDRGQSSWVTLCTKDAACIGSAGTPIMHNKFFLFSSTSGSSNVVVQTSSNLMPESYTGQWNNAVTLAGNTGLYNAYVKYFNDLAAKVKNSDYYTTVGSGNAKVYFFPRAGSNESTDTIYNALDDNVTCQGNSTVGTPDTHRTVIRIGMWYFSRDDIARKLRDLANEKCWIEIVYTTMDAGVRGYLTSSDRIVLYHIPDPYIIHSKYMLIEGTYAAKKDSKWVFTGSHNYTNAALRENDETLLRVNSNAIHDQYTSNFLTARAAANKE